MAKKHRASVVDSDSNSTGGKRSFTPSQEDKLNRSFTPLPEAKSDSDVTHHSTVPDIQSLLTSEVKTMLLDIENINFSIFEFSDLTSGQPLFVMSHTLFIESGLLSRLSIPNDKFLSFMHAIESGYDSQLACTLN